jgi:membrane-bound ClpP family serine protease
LLAAGWLLVFHSPGRPLQAQEAPNAGLVVQVPPTLTTEATNRLRNAIHGPVKRFEAQRAPGGKFVLVCDFNADGQPNASDDFEACLKLARYLRTLARDGVETVAFVHGEVTRHSVLVALACDQIVMSTEPMARLGKVADGGPALDKVERLAYEEVTHKRFPPVLIHKMHDRDLVVIKVAPTEKGGDRYRSASETPRPEGRPVPELGRGGVALYTGQEARDYGLCQKNLDTLEEVMRDYNLPRTSLQQPLDRPVAWRVVVSGPIDAKLKEQIDRRIRRALGQKANLLILQLECGDGASQTPAHELALILAHLNDNRRDNPVKTIAYVTEQARNTATFLAFACDQIVMDPKARLGDFDRFVQTHPGVEATTRANLMEVAGKQHYPVILAEGMLSEDLRIHKARSKRGESREEFVSEQQLKTQKDDKDNLLWESKEVIKPAGKYLTLDADTARSLGVARAVVRNLDELYDLEGVSPSDVRTADTDWLDDLGDFLRHPWTSVVLVMMGITCLILELKMPGVSLPGVIAAVCFVLFFWSHSQLNGQIVWLALLLFILGLLLIGLEIFVLPGFGVSGISGILLVVAGLGLVAYGHWPRSEVEWRGFGQAVAPFGISILGALAAVFVLARYLPSIPLANRLILQPQSEADELSGEAPDAVQAELAALLGAIGVAATPLRPAGKVQFGDAFVDVVAEGCFVQPGTRVQVVEIEGNRVVVKEV